MSSPATSFIHPNVHGELVLGKDPMQSLNSFEQRISSFEVLLNQAPPMPPGKHEEEYKALQLRLENCSNTEPSRSPSPISSSGDHYLSLNRPMSPETDLSSPRSASSPQTGFALPYSPDSSPASPRRSSDCSNNPIINISPVRSPTTSARRSLHSSANTPRPTISLNSSNSNTLKTFGSSPFRDPGHTPSKNTRPNSQAADDIGTRSSKRICQRLDYL